ncbi:hypothetical protein Tco_1034019, partial [Tanacetum coccineum]
MHFLKASPFGLVSMYLKNRDRYCAYCPVASIGGRSLEPAAMMLLCISLSVVEVTIGVLAMLLGSELLGSELLGSELLGSELRGSELRGSELLGSELLPLTQTESTR